MIAPHFSSQGQGPALLFTTQTITIRHLCCHSSQTWQGRGRGAQTGTHFTSQSTLTVMIVFIGKFSTTSNSYLIKLNPHPS